MNDSRSIALSAAITYVLWANVLVSFVVTCFLAVLGSETAAIIVGLWSCLSTGIAAVFTIRCYVVRVCGLIRHVHGLDAVEGGQARSLHTIP